jgi:hypothetical protein
VPHDPVPAPARVAGAEVVALEDPVGPVVRDQAALQVVGRAARAKDALALARVPAVVRAAAALQVRPSRGGRVGTGTTAQDGSAAKVAQFNIGPCHMARHIYKVQRSRLLIYL